VRLAAADRENLKGNRCAAANGSLAITDRQRTNHVTAAEPTWTKRAMEANISEASAANLPLDELLAASRNHQQAWLKATDPDYQERAYERELELDFFYLHEPNWLEELRATYGDELAEYLARVEPALSPTCIDHVVHGGVIEAEEAQAILDHVAERGDDYDWVSLIGWYADCLYKRVFVLCFGRSHGQGGLHLSLAGIFPSQADAEQYGDSLRIVGQRMQVTIGTA